MKQLKVIVEKHPDGYVAYPLGLKGVVVGQGVLSGYPKYLVPLLENVNCQDSTPPSLRVAWSWGGADRGRSISS